MTNSSTIDCQTETPQTFKEIAQDFLDEINHQLEEGNIDLGIKTSVEDIYEMLNSIVEYL